MASAAISTTGCSTSTRWPSAATVYALDLPGHGQSAKTLADPTVAGLARTVVAFMDALGIDRAHLVGHSLGGAIAMDGRRHCAAAG